MSLFVAWIVFPLVMSVLALGLGLLVEVTTGVRLRGTLLLPTGFAVMVVVASLTTMTGQTAPVTVPLVVALAVGGLLSGYKSHRRVDAWPAISALGVFAVFAAPVVLSGSTNFTGWIKLDDGATWLTFADRLVEHGRNVSGLAHSSYEVVLSSYLDGGYPVGAFPPLGIGGKLVPEDPIWLLQPYMAFGAALLALVLYDLVSRVVDRPALRALTAFVGAQAALFYGYVLWGGLKEAVVAPLVALVAALTVVLLRTDSQRRSVVPLAVASSALLAIQGFGGGLQLLPILVPALILVARARGIRFTVGAVGLFAAISVALCVPTIATTPAWLDTVRGSSELSPAGLVNLFRPLKLLQGVGIWPAGDFRVDPDAPVITYALIALALAAAAAGIIWCVRRRAPELPLFVASAVVTGVVLTVLSSPWLAAKGLATSAPALVTAAMVGAGWLVEHGRRLAGGIVAAALVVGVLWSTMVQYHDASLAPHDQLAELQSIGDHFAGEGPALMIDYTPYGSRYLLRRLDAEGAADLRWNQIPLRDGTLLDRNGDADIDDFQTGAVFAYPTLVLRRSATASRPPSAYRLVERGRFYDVWQQAGPSRGSILEHLPLGNRLAPAAVPKCSDVLALARLAGPNGTLAAVQRPNPRLYDLSSVSIPSGWRSDPGNPGTVLPNGAGDAATVVRIARPDRYAFFLGGSFRGHLDFHVDAKRVFSGRQQENWTGKYTPLGEVELARGRHLLLLRYGGEDLGPGGGGSQYAFGPLAFGVDRDALPVTYVRPKDARALCGKRLDWVEAVG